MLLLPSQTGKLIIYDDIVWYQDQFRAYVKEEYYDYFSHRDWEYSIVARLACFMDTDIVLDVGGAHSAFLPILSELFSKGFIVDMGNYIFYKEWYAVVSQYLEVISGKVTIIRTNAVDLPFKDNYFDKVVTISALEHFVGDEDVIAAKEIQRVLKPGGTFLGTVDFSPFGAFPGGTDPLIGSRTYTYDDFESRIVCGNFKHMEVPIRVGEFPDPQVIAPLFFKVVKEN